MTPRTLNVDEAASLLHIHPQTLMTRARSGVILRIPLMADSDSIPIADSVPCDGGHVARVS